MGERKKLLQDLRGRRTLTLLNDAADWFTQKDENENYENERTLAKGGSSNWMSNVFKQALSLCLMSSKRRWVYHQCLQTCTRWVVYKLLTDSIASATKILTNMMRWVFVKIINNDWMTRLCRQSVPHKFWSRREGQRVPKWQRMIDWFNSSMIDWFIFIPVSAEDSILYPKISHSHFDVNA